MLLSQIKMLQAVTLGLRLEHILWDDLSNRKRTQDLEIKMSGNLNSSGSLKTDARGSSKYRLDSSRAQQIRWNKGGLSVHAVYRQATTNSDSTICCMCTTLSS